MSFIRIGPTVTTVERTTCRFHQEHPGGEWAGCTCSTAFKTREKTWAEMTEAERKFMCDPYPGAYIPSSGGG